jgi:hypothetical protein
MGRYPQRGWEEDARIEEYLEDRAEARAEAAMEAMERDYERYLEAGGYDY